MLAQRCTIWRRHSMRTVKLGVQGLKLEASWAEMIPRRENVKWGAPHNQPPVCGGGTAFWSAQVLM